VLCKKHAYTHSLHECFVHHFFLCNPFVLVNYFRVGRRLGASIGRNKMADLDSMSVTEMPVNSVTYPLLNRPQEDVPVFVYGHVIKLQIAVQVGS
jgi:hypothetical protein